MDIKSKIGPLTVGITIFALILAGVGFWYWQKGKSPTPFSSQPVSQPQVTQKTADISLGSQILQKTQNPAKDKLPETNPFSNTETNPLKRVIKNPF